MKKLKRFVCALLAVITVLSVLPASTFAAHAASQGFTDVPAGSYYEYAVQWAKECGVTSGTSATTFSPNAVLTRGQMVTFLWVLAGRPAFEDKEEQFVDVTPDMYCYTPVRWAVNMKMTSGTDNTPGHRRFSPNDAIISEQAIALMYNASSKINGVTSTTAGTLNGSACSTYAKPAYNWANAQGYLSTVPEFAANNQFTGSTVVTRGMAIYMLWEMMTGDHHACVVRAKNLVDIASSYKGWYGSQFGWYVDWCEYFVGKCVSEAGLGDNYTYREAGRMMKAFLNKGNLYISSYFHNNDKYIDRLDDSDIGVNINAAKWTTGFFMPRCGDVILFQRGEGSHVGYVVKGGDEWFSHVGIVMDAHKNSDGTVTVSTVEGNCDDQVQFRTRTFYLDSGRLVSNGFDYVIGFGRFN